MSWENNIDFSTVSPVKKPVAEGDYTYGLAGAQYNGSKLIIKARVSSDGEFKGRGVTFNLPDPESNPWVTTVFARLRESLKVDMFPGEDPASYLNRAAQGGAEFSAPLTHRKYFPDGSDEERVAENIAIFKIRAAV